MRKEEVLRETKSFYKECDGYASPLMIEFAAKHAGHTILDVGCATGEYSAHLNRMRFSCVGVDVNPSYVAIAKNKHGVEAYCMKAENLGFPDNAFDTVILFEILEHVPDVEAVLIEARRIARKNVLITTPDCTDFMKLKQAMLTYRHTLEREHIHFFTKSDLEALLSCSFSTFMVEQREPIWPQSFLPAIIRKPISLLYRMGLLVPPAYNRLYAIARLS